MVDCKFSYQIEPDRMMMATQELSSLLNQDRFIGKVVRKGCYLQKAEHGCVYAIDRILFNAVDAVSLIGIHFTFLRGQVVVEFDCVVELEKCHHRTDFQTNIIMDTNNE